MMLTERDRLFVLTGAGISAESGLATFRGSGGLWNGYRVDQVGKLPIPGRGEIDLRMFKEFLGALPLEARPTPAPAATPAPKATPAPVKT